MSSRYDLGADENIFVFRPPARGCRRDDISSSSIPSKTRISWTDKLRRKLEKYDKDAEGLTDPLYWIYLLVAFGILTLVVLGLYWVLQSARTAVARKRLLSNQAVLQAYQQQQRPIRPPIMPPPPPSITSASSDQRPSPMNAFQIDNSGRNPEICRSGTCPGSKINTNSNNNNGNSNNVNSGYPRLTYSASAGIAPTSQGGTIRGGLGRDVCIGCKCMNCNIPGQCSNGGPATLGVPYLHPNSLNVRIGEGFSEDPFLT